MIAERTFTVKCYFDPETLSAETKRLQETRNCCRRVAQKIAGFDEMKSALCGLKFMTLPFIDCHTHIGVEPAFYVQGNYPYAYDYRSLLDQARRNGVQRVVTFPFVSYFGWEGLSIPTPEPTAEDDFTVPYAFENRRHLKEIYVLGKDVAEAALPLVIVDPSRGQEGQVAALREMRRTFPIFGLKIQATMIRAFVRDLLGTGRCLVDLAAEWDVPMLIHSSILAEDPWSQAQDILDVAEARPDVRFCLAHSCRFDQPSLERMARLPNTWFDCSAHCIHCDAAVDDSPIVALPEHRLAADYSRPDRVMKALYEVAPDRMMWGSDAPFYSYVAMHDGKLVRLLSSYEREIRALDALSSSEKTAILHDNTVRFLGQEI